MAAGRVIVSVHDVAPSTLAEVRTILADLDRCGIGRRVLKVIPNKDGVEDIRKAPDLLRLLESEVARGSEIVQHGYTHRLQGRPSGPLVARWRARLFAGNNAECLQADRVRVVSQIVTGRELLQEAGLEAPGFCAPAWLGPPYLPGALKRAGFRFYTGMRSVRDLSDDHGLIRLGWSGYMGAGRFQERLIAFGAALDGLAHRKPVAVRVYIHPQGTLASPYYARTLQSVARLARAGELVTYGDLLYRP